MSEKPLATPRGSHADNENSHLECQTGTTAHIEPKGQFGKVSNLDGVPPFILNSDSFIRAFHGGSRVMCSPAPTNTDDDYVVLISGDLAQYRSNFATMEEQGFALGGSKALNNAGFNKFQSWKRGYLNIILTKNEEWYLKMLLATRVCALLNVREKPKRVKVFEAIVYGLSP